MRIQAEWAPYDTSAPLTGHDDADAHALAGAVGALLRQQATGPALPSSSGTGWVVSWGPEQPD